MKALDKARIALRRFIKNNPEKVRKEIKELREIQMKDDLKEILISYELKYHRTMERESLLRKWAGEQVDEFIKELEEDGK